MNDIAFIVRIQRTIFRSSSGGGLYMLLNLRAEMARINVKPKDLAELLNVRLATIYDKLNGRYDFSLSEAIKIKRHFFPNHDFENLFEKVENKQVQ